MEQPYDVLVVVSSITYSTARMFPIIPDDNNNKVLTIISAGENVMFFFL